MQAGAVGASCVWRPAEHGLRCPRFNHAVAANHPKVGKMGWKRGKVESGENCTLGQEGRGSCLLPSRGKETPAAPSTLRVRGNAED